MNSFAGKKIVERSIDNFIELRTAYNITTINIIFIIVELHFFTRMQ